MRGGQGDDARSRGQARREKVESVGRVPGEDYRIVLSRADERADAGTSALEVASAHGGRVTCAPVHAAVPGQSRRDGFVGGAQTGRARGAVEIRMADEAAGDQRDEQVRAVYVEREKALQTRLRAAASDRDDGGHCETFSD